MEQSLFNNMYVPIWSDSDQDKVTIWCVKSHFVFVDNFGLGKKVRIEDYLKTVKLNQFHLHEKMNLLRVKWTW